MKIQAIHKKYQQTVMLFISWNAKYDAIVDATSDNGGRAQERAYENALAYWERLTKREQANIVKFLPSVKGCY